MKLNLKHQKTGIFGIQGSGKTYLAEHFLIKNFKHPFVYLMHPEDFTSCGQNVKVMITKNPSAEEFNRILEKLIPMMKRGEIDAVFVDEADLVFPKDFRTLQSYVHIHDFVINHRHYGVKKGEGCALVYLSRRPQDITTNIVETSKHIFLFTIEGKNVKDYMNSLHEDYKDLMPSLNIQNHNFIYKELGSKPALHSGITIK